MPDDQPVPQPTATPSATVQPLSDYEIALLKDQCSAFPLDEWDVLFQHPRSGAEVEWADLTVDRLLATLDAANADRARLQARVVELEKALRFEVVRGYLDRDEAYYRCVLCGGEAHAKGDVEHALDCLLATTVQAAAAQAEGE